MGFERDRARQGLLQEPPRPVTEPLINPKLWWQIILQGLGITMVSLGFYFYGDKFLGDPELGRTLAFVSLVLSQIILILLTREWQQVKTNKLLLGISVGTVVALTLVMTVPAVRMVFHFTPISWLLVGILSVVSFLAMSFISLLVLKRK